ncbi:hypothetical protein MCOR02_000973 [Pyricularia oryzae]|uniref:Family A G protein-coupled receptor-like protein n=4 Tax=Pyricularia TaxID=48558 RepID=A0ABQ8NSJ1_PYRGI|nr:hypothetical protein OOU_Y34scaffold00969g25 [Pyricularia oryzae Y34]KAH8837973.1 hypothetical protein MCOR01_009418 [Pyricularia oryzae]KAI6301528.1 hypothetical protein MCOR33_002921 [Pyricularia grisea]KAH9437318.1 hypothetical protein MCOR02_000973 [Pyricularia oryzae]KAI6261196.1 hypothetical protein MCOR19_002494 [Pyricularia oryzae]
MSGNQALEINSIVGSQANTALTNHGSDWYFTVTALMAVSAVIFTGAAIKKPLSHRVFHQASALFCFVAAIGYFSMASGLGQVPIQAEFTRPDSSYTFAAGTREIFYARYVDWAVSLPLVVLALMMSSGVPLSTTLTTMVAAEIFNVCLLIGALTQTTYKWGYFTFAVMAEWFVFYQLLIPGRKYASAVGGSVGSTYLTASLLVVVCWLFYPVSWGLSEGGNVIHPDSEAIFYGILDIFSRPAVGFVLLLGHRNTDFASLGFEAREPGQGNEKTPVPAQGNNGAVQA